MNNEKRALIRGKIDQIETEINETEKNIYQLEGQKEVPGSIVFKWIKCGKPKCHCMAENGEQHGPYPHLQWWEDGKLKTKYLNRKNFKQYRRDVDRTTALKENKKKLEELQKEKRKLDGILKKTELE